MKPRTEPHHFRIGLPMHLFLLLLTLPIAASGQEAKLPQLRLLLAADVNGIGTDRSGGAAGGLRIGNLAVMVSGHYAFSSGTTGLYEVERELSGVTYSISGYQPLLGARQRKRRPGAIACPAWGSQRVSSERARSERRFRLEALARIGYQREAWDYELRPRSSEGVPPSRSYRVLNHGVQAAAGFSIRYASICADLVFSATATQPTVEADHNPFGTGLYTHQRPFAFRLTTQPLARIGFSIPLTSTNKRQP